MVTVKELRSKGYRVKVRHKRIVGVDVSVINPFKFDVKLKFGTKEPKKDWMPFPRGGETVVEVYKDEKLVATANAMCSHNDTYNKKRGVRICLGRIQNLV